MQTWCLSLQGYVCCFIRPKIQVIGSLSKSLLFIENIYGGACNYTLSVRSLHVVNSDTQKGNKSEVLILNGHNNFFLYIEVLFQTSEKIGLERPTIKPKFYNYKVLKRSELKIGWKFGILGFLHCQLWSWLLQISLSCYCTSFVHLRGRCLSSLHFNKCLSFRYIVELANLS